MSILNYQVGTSYVSMADVADLDAFSAHHLRAAMRNGNLAMTTAQHIITLAWPTFDPGEGINRSPILYAFPAWRQILPPIPIAYKPGHTHAQVRARLLVASGKTVYLGFATTTNGRSAASLAYDDAAVLKVGGTGAWATYDLDGVPLGPSNDQTMQVFLAAELGASASGGGPASGTVDVFGERGFTDYSSAWTGYVGDGLVEFTRGGTRLGYLRRVVALAKSVGATDNDSILVEPRIIEPELTALQSASTDYAIYQQPSLRIGSISLAAEASL